MSRKRYSPEEIISKLREAEVLLSQDKTVSEVVRQLGVSEQTYYRWEKEYGGLDKTQARRLKALEKDNLQLKTLVADLSLDNAILKEVLSKKDFTRPAAGGRRTSPGCVGSLRTARRSGDWTTAK